MTKNTNLLGLLLLLLCTNCQSPDNQQSVDDGQSLLLEEGTNMSIALSPGNDKLLFDLVGRLWVQNIGSTAEAIPITDPYGNAREASWSPDGSKITFQAYWKGNWHIYIVDANGDNLKQITSGLYDHREPDWSPDGKRILYSSDRNGNYDVWEYELSKMEHQSLTSDPFNQYAPHWNKATDGFAYIDENPDDAGIKYREGGVEKLLYPSENLLTALSFEPQSQRLFFQEGGLLKYTSMQENLDKASIESMDGQDLFPFSVQWLDAEHYLYVADGKIRKKGIGTNSFEDVPFRVKLEFSRDEYQAKAYDFSEAKELAIKGIFMPRLSPDGQMVSMVLMKDLWLRTSEGQMEQITDDPYVEMAPCWSPDQKQIAFVSDRGGAFAIWLYTLENSNLEKLTNLPASVGGLSWSADGTKIAYSLSYGPRLGRLFYYDFKQKQSVNAGGMLNSSLGAPSWSPDGKTIAVSTLQKYSSRFREGVNGVVYYDIETKKQRPLGGLEHFSVGVRAYNGPEWSPTGRYLAAISASRLWIIPVDEKGELNGEPKRITEELADAPSWSADGKHLLYIATDQLVKINIENLEKEILPLALSRSRNPMAGTTLIRAGKLFNGLQSELLSGKDILIEGNRIKSILTSSPENEALADRFIDASQQVIMPGLIDIHSHQGSWEGEKLSRSWLAWGVTSTRDPASDPYDALNRREAMEAGKVAGPRIFFTGSPFDGNRIYYGGANALQDAEQIQLELDRAEHLDFDLIKTYVRLPDSLQKIITQRAHEIGVPVTSHELYPAVAYGVDGVEHILGTSRRGYSPKMTSNFNAYNDVIQMLAKSGMSFTPTTGIYVTYNAMLAKHAEVLEDQRVKELMPPFLVEAAKAGIKDYQANEATLQINMKNALQMIKDVNDAGGLVVAGTDSPIIPYGFSLHMELLAYKEAGLSNFEVLKTTGMNAAKVLQLEQELGSIEEGKLADLLILNQNPLEDLNHLRDIDQVMVDGRIYKMEELLQKPEL